MSYQLTEEQLMIRSMAKEFSRKHVAETAKQRDETKEFPREILTEMGQLGLMGMTIPPEYGGGGADTVGYVLALSEIAYSCASVAVIMSVHNSIVCESILNFGSEEQKAKYLPQLTSAEKIGAFALTEPHAGSDPVAQSTSAQKEGDFYVLNGTKRFITSGKNSGLVIVTAKTDPDKRHAGISAFIVEKDTPGLIVGNQEDKLGLRGSDTTDLLFENCRVPVENILGNEGDGFKVAMSALDRGRIGIAAQSIGVATAALDAAVDYINQREQFGKKIGKFQGIRWMIADMATEIEAARQLMFSAVYLKEQGVRYTKEASMAKLYASEMVNRITGQAIQLHGGYGFSKDYPVERYYRDARVFTIYEGTSEIQRIVISNAVIGDK